MTYGKLDHETKGGDRDMPRPYLQGIDLGFGFRQLVVFIFQSFLLQTDGGMGKEWIRMDDGMTMMTLILTYPYVDGVPSTVSSSPSSLSLKNAGIIVDSGRLMVSLADKVCWVW